MPRTSHRPPLDWAGAGAARFDVRAFARTAVGHHRDAVDPAAFSGRPLADDTLVALAYLRDLERATMSRLRDVLVTPTHKDARVTGFLTTWAFEKFWIADALVAVLAAHGHDETGWDGLGDTGGVAERSRPVLTAITTNLIGPDVVVSHLAEGVVDEGLTQHLYRAVLARDPHPELAELVDDVLAVKARHLEFFVGEARARLAASRRARVLARRAVLRTPFPLGSVLLGQGRTRAAVGPLLAGTATSGLDEDLDAMPGLTATRPAARTAARLAASGGRTLAARTGYRLGRAAATLTRRVRS